MSTYMKYGYGFGPRVVQTERVSSAGTIGEGDIVVRDAVSPGCVKRWSAPLDAVVGVAMEGVPVAPSVDGDESIQVALAMPGTAFVFPAPGITRSARNQCCDISGPQSIDFNSDIYQNAWIIEEDEEGGLVYVMLKGPFTDIGAAKTIGYGLREGKQYKEEMMSYECLGVKIWHVACETDPLVYQFSISAKSQGRAEELAWTHIKKIHSGADNMEGIIIRSWTPEYLDD